MRHFDLALGAGGAVLTAYLHSLSPELSNACLRPAVLIFPGGGYKRCTDREAEPIALAYLAEGYNAFVLRYRAGTEVPFEAPLQDARLALAALRQNAAEWNLCPDHIALLGFSAGGHLAAALATLGPDRPNALLLGYAVLKAARLGGKDYIDLVGHVDEKTPPAFLFATRNDELVPPGHALAFAAALETAGVEFELHLFQNGAHGLALAKPLTANGLARAVDSAFAQWLTLSVIWLKRLWGDFTVGEPSE